MTNIKKKNKVLSFITMLVLLPMLLLSVFVPLQSRQIKNVSANTVITDYSFVGSDVCLPFTSLTYLEGINTYRYVLGEGNNAFYVGYSNFTFSFRSSSSELIIDGDLNYFGYLFPLPSYSINLSLISDSARFFVPFSYDGTTIYISFWINLSSSNLSYDFYKVAEYSGWDSSTEQGGNHIVYYDNNENYVDIFVNCDYSPVNDSIYTDSYPYGLDSRVYYFINDFTDNEYYNNGYNTGYSSGESFGYNNGYSAGEQAGQIVGYNNGYSAGVEAGGNYTFLSLIGAVIDAPVSAFTSLLNFELLGINLLSFITGLLTLAIIIFIIKLTLGGK